MKRILFFLCLFPMLGTLRAADVQRLEKPNVLIILADDLGYADLGVQGLKEVATPHIDSIASGGVRFTSGYTSGTMCSPTRAGLLTGRYQARFGHEFNYSAEQPQAGLPAGEKTIADRLRDAGYVTGLIGKWHVGEVQQEVFHPLARGFAESVYYGGQQKLAPRGALRGREKFMEKEFIGTAMAREAGNFFTRHAAAPWFLYYALNLVHTPNDVLDTHLARVPVSVTDETRRRYLASVAAMDDSVGLVLEKLRSLSQEERTLIFFLSDNGGAFGSDNRPLKGGKGNTVEGGIRVPFFAQWKGVIPAGRVLDQPVISLDLLPTALAAANADVKPEWKLDGANLLPLLKGESTAPPHPEGLFWRFGDQWAVRLGDWKLVQAGSRKLGPVALYHVSEDIGEKTNLLAQQPGKERELRAAWERWNQANIPARWVLKE
jgi:arylsulfatase A-like enzyme